ncbi:hypothetical protein RFZ55_07120, partial [Acinetobacter baumannii]|nr:hypothetical protein [Acinetobacter baumannii]
WYNGAAERTELNDVDAAFSKSCHLQLIDARIQHVQRLFYIDKKCLSAFCKYNITAIFFKELNAKFFLQRGNGVA